jgi:acyl-coenzyme A synthetase/AMP-(fatty) acid ligase
VNPIVKKMRILWKYSIEAKEEFWDRVAKELYWFRYYDNVVSSKHPYYYWFDGGEINITYNIFDAHQERKNKVALIWESENGEKRMLSYGELQREVESLASSLNELGVKKGDVVTIYMPMIPEAMIAMLACARLGAIHNVVFGGFGAYALKERLISSNSKALIIADLGFRRGKEINYIENVKKALEGLDNIIMIVKSRGGYSLENSYSFDELLKSLKRFPPCRMKSSDPLFILYTSGTTGKPKGVVHAVGPYSVWAYFHVKWLFNFSSDDIFFSLPDIGWINGHSYSTYGPLLNGATILWYEGVPDYPDHEVWWRLVEKYGITYMWVAPTAIRILMKYSNTTKYDISSLKMIVSAGEILGIEPWKWLVNLTNGQTYVIETWGQTENSGFITSPGGFLIGGIYYKVGSVGHPLPGIDVSVVDENGNELPPNTKGHIVIKSTAPAFMIYLWRDEERYKQYYSRFGVYYTGDFGYIDEEGYVYILGRTDDVIKIAGHRISPAEIENVVLEHPAVAEASVVGVPDPEKGNVLVVFVTLKKDFKQSEELKSEIIKNIRERVGPIVVIKEVYFLDKLPKTRTGKIMRRVLRAIITKENLGDLSTLEEQEALEELKKLFK